MKKGDDMKRNQYWKKLFILVYAFGALSTTQTIPLIKHFGFSETQQGFLLASIALFTIFLQIGFGILSDKTGKMKPYFLVLFLCCTGLTGILYMNTFQEFWLVFLLVGGIGGACRCYQTMMDTWVMQCDQEKGEFEKDKAIGSVGWALGAWAAALICSWGTFYLLALISLFISFIAIFFAWKTKDGHRSSTMKWSQLKELISNQEYVILIFIMLVLFAMGCADIYLVVDKIISLGGNSFHIGLKWGIQSLAEAPVFLFSDKLLERFKMIPLLIFSTIMFGLRFMIYSFLQNVWWIVAAALMQSVTFPIAIYCTKIGIDRCTSTEIKSTGQLAGASIYMGVSLLVMPVLTSWLSNALSIDGALLVVTGFSLVGLLLIFRYKKIIS